MQREAAPGAAFLTEIRIEGLEGEAADIARREIAATFGAIGPVCEEWGLSTDALTLRVWVPADFDAAVNVVLREYDRDDGVVYTSQRETGTAVGKTMYSRDEDRLRATIVLSPAFWEHQGGWPQLQRHKAMLHEMYHLLLEAIRRTRPREPEKRLWERTFHESLPLLAGIAYEECCVDGLVDAAIRGLGWVKDDQGNALGLADWDGPEYAGAVRTLLEDLCRWVQERVQHYRVTSQGLDRVMPELWPRLDAFVTMLGRAFGSYVHPARTHDLRALLEEAPGFAAFLADDWADWERAFTGPRQEALEQIPELIVCLVNHLGLAIEDHPSGGGYVHVHEPRFCG